MRELVLPNNQTYDFYHPSTSDVGNYDDEQLEFMLAMTKLKRILKRQPTASEILKEAIRLGYRKQ
jgi:hypothetical protein